MQITLYDCLFIFIKFISSQRKISCMQYVVVNAEPVSFFLFSIWIEVLTFICFVPVDPFLVSRITTVLGGCIHLPKNVEEHADKVSYHTL